MKVKEALDGIGGGDGDEKWYEKVISGIGNTEVGMKVLNKLTGDGPAAPQQPQPQRLPPPGVPFTTNDGTGRVFIVNQQGQVQLYDPAREAALQQQKRIAAAKKKKRAANAAAAAKSGAPATADATAAPAAGEEGVDPELEEALDDEPPIPMGRPPDAKELSMAVKFMENAINSGATPENFGRSVGSFIPGAVLQYMQSVGIDRFLSMARLDQGSALTTVRGRTFARAVARYLSEGTTEEPTP